MATSSRGSGELEIFAKCWCAAHKVASQLKVSPNRKISQVWHNNDEMVLNGDFPTQSILQALYSSNVVAKIWGVAAPAMSTVGCVQASKA